MEDYQPVNELVYDDLKMAAASGREYDLQFRSDTGVVTTTKTTITDVFRDETGEYLLAGNGLIVRLQQLVSINGKPVDPIA